MKDIYRLSCGDCDDYLEIRKIGSRVLVTMTDTPKPGFLVRLRWAFDYVFRPEKVWTGVSLAFSRTRFRNFVRKLY